MVEYCEFDIGTEQRVVWMAWTIGQSLRMESSYEVLDDTVAPRLETLIEDVKSPGACRSEISAYEQIVLVERS